MATPTGLEPAASAVTGRRANQLRYGAMHQENLRMPVPQKANACMVTPPNRYGCG
jgi:hypothetical protein